MQVFEIYYSHQQHSEVNEMKAAYEVHNPSFNDMSLLEQIEAGINDWAVQGKSGHIYFGRSAQEAIKIAALFDNR